MFFKYSLHAVFLSILTLMSPILSAQSRPPAQISSITDCKLQPGVTMEDAVNWAKGLERGANAAGRIWYRHPLTPSPDYEYDFQIGRYYESWMDYVVKTEGVDKANRPSSGSRIRPSVSRGSIMDCDPKTRRIVNQVNTGGAIGPADETLMTTRFCRLDEGKTMNDAWQRAVSISDNWRATGDRNMMQLRWRAMKPPLNNPEQGRVYILIEVGSTPESLAERLDKARIGFSPLTGSERVSTCTYRTLWRTHLVHQNI